MVRRILRIGVVGYSDPKFSIPQAIKYLREAFNLIEKEYPNVPKEVVSGLTDLGIPGLAYREAVRRGWRTAGIACKLAANYKCFPVNDRRIIGNNWGDESPIFLKSIDIMVKVGGGKQSVREAAEARARGKQVIAFNLRATS